MNESFDVIVVGARCAGAPLATMLARDGLRVCLVDKDRFPSDTPSTHGIQPIGIQVLERIGVLDSLLKLAPPILRLRMVFDDSPVPAADVVAITGAPGLSVRRTTLDEILVNAAADAGAEVRPQTAVTGLVVDSGRVAGVTTPSGELRAPLVVGADGTRSAVARMVGAQEYHPTPNGRVFMWAYYEADPTDGEMWIGKVGDHTYLGMPTDGGLTLIGVCPSIERRNEVRADREEGHWLAGATIAEIDPDSRMRLMEWCYVVCSHERLRGHRPSAPPIRERDAIVVPLPTPVPQAAAA